MEGTQKVSGPAPAQAGTAPRSDWITQGSLFCTGKPPRMVTAQALQATCWSDKSKKGRLSEKIPGTALSPADPKNTLLSLQPGRNEEGDWVIHPPSARTTGKHTAFI